MSSTPLNSDDFGLKLYNRFPPKYREDDIFQNYALKRYLEAINEGGFKYTLEELNGIPNLIDPDIAGSKILPILYEQYGFDLFNGIPEAYLRYLLPRLGEAWSKKGSLDVIEFVMSTLSGIKTSTDVTTDEYGNTHLDVRLEMDSNLLEGYFPDPVQFDRILDKFVPFYIQKVLMYSFMFAETQRIEGKDNYAFDKIREVTKELPDLIALDEDEMGISMVFNDGTSLFQDSTIDFHSGLITNSFKSATNESYILIPDTIDRITYRNGDKDIVYGLT